MVASAPHLDAARLRIEGENLQPYAANMQSRNWNDLRYVLAIKRGLTLTAAARQLGVDDTTVSRRLAALQSVMGIQLCVRHADGTLELRDGRNWIEADIGARGGDVTQIGVA